MSPFGIQARPGRVLDPEIISTVRMGEQQAKYIHGHHESVLRSHTVRTAANSVAYLLPHIQPHMEILDIGCGPGTITVDLAKLVPQGHARGLEPVAEPLEHARSIAAKANVSNVDFVIGDANALDFPDGTFDIVHTHQVLQHVEDPVGILKEMKRVAKPGGLVASSASDWGGFIVFPEVNGMKEFIDLFPKVSKHNGGEQEAGRRLARWAHDAGFGWHQITPTASTWCYSTPDERAWWSGLWADRILASSFGTTAVESGLATQEMLELCAQAWNAWGSRDDGWFAFLKGEIICRV